MGAILILFVFFFLNLLAAKLNPQCWCTATPIRLA